MSLLGKVFTFAGDLAVDRQGTISKAVNDMENVKNLSKKPKSKPELKPIQNVTINNLSNGTIQVKVTSTTHEDGSDAWYTLEKNASETWKRREGVETLSFKNEDGSVVNKRYETGVELDFLSATNIQEA